MSSALNRPYARSPLPGENCQPPCGRDRNRAAAHGPLSGCKGSCAGDWPSGPGEPLGWPVRAFPIPVSVPTTPYRSARFGPPASRSGSPPDSGEPVERVSALRRPPRVLDSPLRLVHQKRCVCGNALCCRFLESPTCTSVQTNLGLRRGSTNSNLKRPTSTPKQRSARCVQPESRSPAPPHARENTRGQSA